MARRAIQSRSILFETPLAEKKNLTGLIFLDFWEGANHMAFFSYEPTTQYQLPKYPALI